MNVSTNDKYAFIVEKLYSDTARGNIAWAASANDSYSTPIGDNIIEISSRERNGDTDIFIFIKDSAGNVQDGFSDVDLADAVPRTSGFNNYFSLMLDLLKRVSRRASGAEDVLDSVLRSLGTPPSQVPLRQLKSLSEDPPF